VLRVFREAAIPIDVVSGTSVGALIATGYCAGTPLEAMQDLALQTKFSDFGRWAPSWLGLATNYRLEQYLSRLTPLKTFEDLQKPLAIAATDINEGLAVYYHSGPIAPALRASCAYPGLFVPIQHEGRTLVDGFLTALVPIEGVLLLGAELEWRQHADVIIEPDVSPYAWDDFTKTMELVRAGEEAALRALPAIRAAIEGKRIVTGK
jgi:NTE family protein